MERSTQNKFGTIDLSHNYFVACFLNHLQPVILFFF